MSTHRYRWLDQTRYNSGERGKIDPQMWTLDLLTVRIIVSRPIHRPIDAWLLSCPQLGITDQLLDAKPARKAKQEALERVAQHVNRIKMEVDTARHQLRGSALIAESTLLLDART